MNNRVCQAYFRRTFVTGLIASAITAVTLPLARAAATSAEDASTNLDVWKSVQLVGTDGQPLSLCQLTAPVVVVHLWASWCAACLGELAPLQDLAGRFGPMGVAIMLVSHPKHWEADQAFLERTHVRLPAYTLAPDTAWELRAAAFGVVEGAYAVPRTLVFAGHEKRRCVLAQEGAQNWGLPQANTRLRAWLQAANTLGVMR